MNSEDMLGELIQGYRINSVLGSGSYGKVYLAYKEDLGKTYLSAIKHIVIPDSEQYEDALLQYNNDKNAVEQHFAKMVEEITSEFNLMLSLNKIDNRFVVTYYDHEIRHTLEPLHYDIFIRMEYLIPLNKVLKRDGMTVADIIKLADNLLDALSLCHNQGIMHRDIKEANIFKTEAGNYKLGDFGVAKNLTELTKAASMKGTATYMAPEICKREAYDITVDLYSLGIVLYKLLNKGRIPFVPQSPAIITSDDNDHAETRRLSGDIPPLPGTACNTLGEVVIKACSPRNLRYNSAQEMKKALNDCALELPQEYLMSWVVNPTEDYNDEGHVLTQKLIPGEVKTGYEICQNCGKSVKTEGNFCTNCGERKHKADSFNNLNEPKPVEPVSQEQNKAVETKLPQADSPEKRRKGKKGLLYLAGMIGLLAICGMIIVLTQKPENKDTEVLESSGVSGLPEDETDDNIYPEGEEEEPDATSTPVPTPTSAPSPTPTEAPTPEPTAAADVLPPTSLAETPAISPTPLPTPQVTAKSTAKPTVKPAAKPTPRPTPKPTPKPTSKPTSKPTPTPKVVKGSVIKWKNTLFQDKVRELLKRPRGDIYTNELSAYTSLDFSNARLTNISDIVYFTNLTSLNLSGNSINDVSPLAELTKLKTLNLSNNQISFLDGLEKLTKIEDLNLSKNFINNIKALEKLTALKKLKLSENQITDANPISGLPKLQELILDNNQIEDLSFLRNLTTLITLDFNRNKLWDLSSTGNLINLKNLSIKDNQIYDISKLKDFPKLTNLEVDVYRISDWSSVSHVDYINGEPNKYTD